MQELQVRAAKAEKTMMNHKYDQENFARQQTTATKNLNDTLNKLAAAILNGAGSVITQDRPPDPPQHRGWRIPPSLTSPPLNYNAEKYKSTTIILSCL